MPMVQSPFERLLAAEFERLPTPVRRLHSLRGPLMTAGVADVTAATGIVAWLICWSAGLPRPGKDIAVSVLFTPQPDGSEHWERTFAERCYSSSLVIGTGRDRGFLVEHFGLFDLRFQLTPRDDGLAWSLAGWRLGPLRLPRWSRPRIECLESADGDRFTFDIDVTFPLVGWLIRYRGWLLPQAGRG